MSVVSLFLEDLVHRIKVMRTGEKNRGKTGSHNLLNCLPVLDHFELQGILGVFPYCSLVQGIGSSMVSSWVLWNPRCNSVPYRPASQLSHGVFHGKWDLQERRSGAYWAPTTFPQLLFLWSSDHGTSRLHEKTGCWPHVLLTDLNCVVAQSVLHLGRGKER